MEDLDGAMRQDEPSAINTKNLLVQAQDEYDIVSELMDRCEIAVTTTPRLLYTYTGVSAKHISWCC